MRRFIAGAVCPNCQALDRLVLEESAEADAKPIRRCVACGFSDDKAAATSAWPRGRVEGGRLKPPVTRPRVVKIIQPGAAGENENGPDS